MRPSPHDSSSPGAAHAPGGIKSVRRVSRASMVGTALEYYDFSLYAPAAALVFGELFFPASSSPWLGTLAAFATYAVGFLVRPVGAIVISHFGDRLGRRSVLILTLLLMGVSTVLIGLLPTYSAIGAAAPVLLVLLRMLQGFGAGAEFSGASLMASEHSSGVHVSRRGRYTSMTSAGTTIGSMVATAVFLLVEQLPREEILAWGWRVPFLLSTVVLAVGLWIRSRVEESPVFEHADAAAPDLREQVQLSKAQRLPVTQVLMDPESRRRILLAFVANWSPFIVGYLGPSFGIAYVTKQLGVSTSVTLVTLMCAYGLRILSIPLLGSLSDRVGRRPMFIASALSMVVMAFPFFWLLETRNSFLIFLALYLTSGICNDLNLACQGTYLSELFPTKVRYTGIALSREFSAALVGGTVPFVATGLVAVADGGYVLVALYMIVAGLLAAWASWRLPETKGTDLQATQTQPAAPPGAKALYEPR